MSVFSQLYDFMFAPTGTYDSDSGPWGASNDTTFNSADPLIINPATCLPMIDNAGVDVCGNPFGFDLSHHNDLTCANNSNMFSHDCSSMFDNHSSSFDSSSMFDHGFSSTDTGSMFD